MSSFESWVFRSELEQLRADDFFESLYEPEDQPNPATPRRLALVDHFHWTRRCEGQRWVAAGGPSKVQPSDLDPGFLNASGQLRLDTKLDDSLAAMMVNDHAAHLAPGSAQPRRPHARDNVRVCIVDMSKGNLCQPRYAGWGSTTPIGAGSTAKVALLYAAHQVIYDLHVLARRHGLTDINALARQAATHWSALRSKPKVKKLATFDGTSVRPSARLRDTIDKMVIAQHSSASTGKANKIIELVGFDFIGSLLWQSGLRHPNVKGLWFPNDFGPTRRWSRDPFRDGRIGLSARSVATFYTLLAQGRLIGNSTSQRMLGILEKGCQFAPPTGATVRGTKCGLTSSLKHNSMLLSASGDLLYAVVCLTRGKARKSSDEMGKLMNGIHRLVVRRNA